MKKQIMVGLTALLISCSGESREIVAPVEPVAPDTVTVYVPVESENQNYTFNLQLRSRNHNDGGWHIEAQGRIYNESDKDIIGLKPKLKIYPSLERMDSDDWMTSNYGDLGERVVFIDNGFVLFDSTDTIPVGDWQRHLTYSDTLPGGIVGYYRFGFEYPDSSLNKKVTGQYIEGKID